MMTSFSTQRTFYSIKKDTLANMRLKIWFCRLVWLTSAIAKRTLRTK